MSNNSRVFVTNETGYDYAPAEAFGEVKFITAGDLNNTKNSFHNEMMIDKVFDSLWDYDPENDWVVISGSPYVSALVFIALGLKGHHNIRILRWDNRDRCYRPMHIDIRRSVVNRY